jgi:hypothetical protein
MNRTLAMTLVCLLAVAATTQPAKKYQITWKLSPGSDKWDAAKRDRIVQSMDAAVALYNELGEFDKQITAAYNPGTPTADGNYNGHINFGTQMNKRVALHEIAHTLGVGQHRNWEANIKDGLWTGPAAIAQLREFDGPDAVLHADRMHFWPYGLNYDKESSPENDRRHVLMVAAIRKDLGIKNGD